MTVFSHRTFATILIFVAMGLSCVSLTYGTDDIPSPSSTPIQDIAGLAGEWEIQEEDKSYTVTLDNEGNGPYTWQGGRIVTIEFSDRKWRGTWQQTGNDREGGFELLLSENNVEAKGVWWYTRVGDRKNIPARQWGGSYVWKRLSSLSSPSEPNPLSNANQP
jgi:hypothetical protein